MAGTRSSCAEPAVEECVLNSASPPAPSPILVPKPTVLGPPQREGRTAGSNRHIPSEYRDFLQDMSGTG